MVISWLALKGEGEGFSILQKIDALTIEKEEKQEREEEIPSYIASMS
jgi:hypothetical protein